MSKIKSIILIIINIKTVVDFYQVVGVFPVYFHGIGLKRFKIK